MLYGLLVGGLPILLAPTTAFAAWSIAASGPTAARATTVNPGTAPATSVAGDTVQLMWRASTLATSEPVSGYRIRRYDASGATEQVVASGSCAVMVTSTTCSESSVPVGTWRYSVTPVHNNWRGAESPMATAQVATPSTAAVTFPVQGASYNATGFTNGCSTTSVGDMCGTAVDGGSGITGVQVSLQRGTGSYWNGTSFASTGEVLFNATGTTSWSYPFAASSFPADGEYTLRTRVTDGAGYTATASATFTVDRTAPVAPTIVSAPANPSSSSSASFGFSHAEPGVRFECRLDGSAWATCTSPRSYSGLSEGSHTFEVRAVDAADNTGTATTRTWAIDTVAPGAAVTFPVHGASYSSSGFTAGCGTASTGDVCGSSSDTGSGVNNVRVSLQRGTGNYWDGTGFASLGEVLLGATGTTSWSHLFNTSNFPADGQYTLRARATDEAGNSTTTSSTFTVDVTAPRGVDVQTANAANGTPGHLDTAGGDSITFSYSERIRPQSILADWDGTARSVVVRVNEGTGTNNDTLTVWNAGNTAQLPIGVVDLGRNDYTGRDWTYSPSTMTQIGSDIRIVLGPRGNGPSNDVVKGPGTMVWTPAAGPTDLVGNPLITSPVTESGPADAEF